MNKKISCTFSYSFTIVNELTWLFLCFARNGINDEKIFEFLYSLYNDYAECRCAGV